MLLNKIIFLMFGIAVSGYPSPDYDDPSITRTKRLVKARKAASGFAPHMVAISSGAALRSFICGGSLISTRHVLTAAHCVDSVYINYNGLTSSLLVSVGTNTWEYGGDSYRVIGNITHSRWNPTLKKNDIGILITGTPVILSTLVKTIALGTRYVDGGVTTRISGWGQSETNGPISKSLLKLTTKTINIQTCVQDMLQATIKFKFLAPPVDPKLELCTLHSVGKGTCVGDSGSALIRKDTGEQIGIVSWGFPCAVGAPDVYTRISTYLKWVKTILEDNRYLQPKPTPRFQLNLQPQAFLYPYQYLYYPYNSIQTIG